MKNLPTILIIDDDVAIHQALAGLLAGESYQLVFAVSGEAGLALAAAAPPDVVLLDVVLPGLSGFEVCRQLRADPHLVLAPILLITSLDDLDARLVGLEAGADDFIPKPFSGVELKARLRTLTRLYRHRRQLVEQARFEQLFELSPDGLALVDAQGFIQQANSALRKMAQPPEDAAGNSAAPLAGQAWQKLLWAEAPAPDPASVDRLFRQPAATLRFVGTLIRTDGTGLPVEVSAGHFVWDDAPMAQFIVRDITARKQAEQVIQESHERFRAAFEATPDSLSISRLADGVYVDVNPGFTRILGYAREEVLGQSALAIPIWDDPQDRQRLVQTLQASGAVDDFETRFRCKDGTVLIGLLSARIITLNHQPHQLVLARDVTRRRQSEEALRKLSRAVEQSPVSIIITDAAGAIEYINPKFTELTGYTGAEASGKNPWTLTTELASAEDFQQIQNTLTGGFVWRGELCSRKKNGDLYWESASISPVTDEMGRITHFVGVNEDITERKQIEQANRESEERFRVAFQTIPDSVSISRLEDGVFIDVNPGFVALTGYAREEVIGKSALAVSIWENAQERQRLVEDVQKGGVSNKLEARFRRKDGTLLWGEAFAQVILLHGRPHLLLIAKDVTGRKQAEEEARLNQRRVDGQLKILQHEAASLPELLDEALAEAMALSESTLGYLFIYNEDSGEFTLHPWQKAPQVYPLEKMGLWGEAVRQRRPIVVNHILAPNPLESGGAAERTLVSRYLALPVFSNERIVAVVGVANKGADYTELDARQLALMTNVAWKIVERKQAESEIRSRTEELEMLAKISAAMRVAQTRSQIASVVSHQLLELFKADSAAVGIGEPVSGDLVMEIGAGQWDHWTGLRLSPGQGISGQVLATSQPYLTSDFQSAPGGGDSEWRGNIRWAACVPLTVQATAIGVMWLGSQQPITERQQRLFIAIADMTANAIHRQSLYEDLQIQLAALHDAQMRLVQSEKLAAVGGLVAGVAHELNNPLSSVVLCAQLLQQQQLEVEANHDLEVMVSAALRAAEIVRGLLDFARQRPVNRQPTQINAVLRQSLDSVAYELQTRGIKCDASLAPELPITMADARQLQQVFINLFSNAWQSLAKDRRHGRLVVTTEAGPSTFLADRAKRLTVIRVTVRDDGPGIPPEVLPRIFDPFFTTKPEGQGTGLGLSICHGIINEHGGHLWAESEPGRGATFHVELPLIAPPATPPAPPPAGKDERAAPRRPAPTASSKVPRILVVDDEPAILHFLERALTRKGYAVDKASDGMEALACLYKKRYDLILCDMRMPELNGSEFYHQVQEKDPELARRIIFTTGDVISETSRQFLVGMSLPYLMKPFQLKQLDDMVEQALASKAPAPSS